MHVSFSHITHGRPTRARGFCCEWLQHPPGLLSAPYHTYVHSTPLYLGIYGAHRKCYFVYWWVLCTKKVASYKKRVSFFGITPCMWHLYNKSGVKMQTVSKQQMVLIQQMIYEQQLVFKQQMLFIQQIVLIQQMVPYNK